MSKKVLALGLALMFIICSMAFADETTLKLTSTSIIKVDGDDVGNLLTSCAANNKFNKPKGGGKSPQLSWTKVEDAKYYAVCMFDVTANWTHWLAKSLPAKKTSLKLGAYTKSSGYIGPYPPAGSGRHIYVIQVFALRGKPDKFTYKNNASGNLNAIHTGLNTRKGVLDNLIAVDSIIAGYSYGDQTKK